MVSGVIILICMQVLPINLLFCRGHVSICHQSISLLDLIIETLLVIEFVLFVDLNRLEFKTGLSLEGPLLIDGVLILLIS